ncbi:class I SAM-dependent methyltransferase [Maioricimonas sp. JC845]|uniref:class I SAM-dependent methyltransferase n=1 Tax=Maioricimonas sp. JC845 TaxID=3232138 RepID=UPI0034598F69
MTPLKTSDSSNAPDKGEIADFYDDFSKRLVRDYVRGNPRIEAAIARVNGALSANVKSILDVGCGIGWSSAEYANACADVTVLGVDISPRNIEIAKRLFQAPRVDFRVSDMTDGLDGRSFDLIALLDVYEHFPAAERGTFHRVLGELLSEDGTMVITTPSRLHQEWLAENNPNGLQVVDEIVTYDDICRLANDLNADVMHFELVSIWHSNDYMHTVLQRGPVFGKLPKQRVSSRPLIRRLLSKVTRGFRGGPQNKREARLKHVRDALGIEIESIQA